MVRFTLPECIINAFNLNFPSHSSPKMKDKKNVKGNNTTQNTSSLPFISCIGYPNMATNKHTTDDAIRLDWKLFPLVLVYISMTVNSINIMQNPIMKFTWLFVNAMKVFMPSPDEFTASVMLYLG